MSGRVDYEERRQARIDRLNAAAGRATEEATRQSQRSHDLVKNIPLGQPNIEGRTALPNLRAKSISAMEKAVALDEKSDCYAERAAAAERNTSISSDDPEAIEKLKNKLAKLEVI